MLKQFISVGIERITQDVYTDSLLTKDAQYHSYYEKTSQKSSEDLTKDLAELTRGRKGHKSEHLLFSCCYS